MCYLKIYCNTFLCYVIYIITHFSYYFNIYYILIYITLDPLNKLDINIIKNKITFNIVINNDMFLHIQINIVIKIVLHILTYSKGTTFSTNCSPIKKNDNIIKLQHKKQMIFFKTQTIWTLALFIKVCSLLISSAFFFFFHFSSLICLSAPK